MASLLPALEIGCSARRELDTASAARSLDHQRWQAVGFVGLRFRARSVAADVPSRSELAPEAWLAPCDSDDEICLQEAADAEQEIATALGELQ
jgi:hypothetical protein